MPDISTIATVVSSIKTATEIAKILRESDLSLEKAEVKLKLAELVGALADAKLQLTDLQDLLVEKDMKIKELEQAFEIKDDLVRIRDAYYEMNAEGQPKGVPFCLHCWENSHKRRPLITDAKERLKRVCTV